MRLLKVLKNTTMDFDKRLLGRVLENIKGDVRIAVLPDHPTPIQVRTHVPDPVPNQNHK